MHTGGGSPAVTRVFDIEYSHVLPHVRISPVFGFRDIVANKVPERFPRLRFGFIEAASSWVPYILHVLRRAAKAPITIGPLGPEWGDRWGPQLFQDYRLLIACEADEDLGYLLRFIGEDNLVVGSDYGHQDPSRDDGTVPLIRRREDIPASAKEKILSDNPRRLYGL